MNTCLRVSERLRNSRHMSDVITPLCGLVGFFAGMSLSMQVTRWVALLYVSGAKEGGDFLGPPKRRLVWAIPFVGLLHPAPWMVGVLGFLAFRAFRSNGPAGWKWFFGGLLVAWLFMAISFAFALARWRHSKHSSTRTGRP